jgi:acylphosphatase
LAAQRVAYRYIVSGNVQGVCFRASTAQQALRLGLTGWANNLPDGRVEVLAVGGDAQVRELAQWLDHGPPLAAVEAVEILAENAADYLRLKDFRTG